MLFKSLAILTAATAAFAAPIACGEQPEDHPNNSSSDETPKYSLHLFPGAGVTGMKPLQLRGENIVYGLEQGFSYFKVDSVGDALVNVISDGKPPGELFVADSGKLVVNEHPAKVGEGYNGGWGFSGDGSVKEFSSYGTREFYSCDSTEDPLHEGQVVYVYNGKYACEDPKKFTIGATKE
ncbi:hypothetical protein CJU90_5870 [Yarrowia sp. C11]|nr:hypothetical protein CJU90_5870 [Yarrowia sp. C11]KAG5364442.1 hypothetical protein CKK34_3248 [Yarrowia sp. E02]